jgi:hypothetical protein
MFERVGVSAVRARVQAAQAGDQRHVFLGTDLATSDGKPVLVVEAEDWLRRKDRQRQQGEVVPTTSANRRMWWPVWVVAVVIVTVLLVAIMMWSGR